MKRSHRRILLGLVYGVSIGALLALAWRGHSYYLSPLGDRPRHEDYWALKPGGSLGHLYGILGASLMTLMHLYSLRRRVRAFKKLGPLSAWLDFHIYCGVMGPLLIVLHSSLKVGGLVSLSFWAMVAVALSGILGRYLYLQLPRRRSGDELTLNEARELDARLGARLEREFGFSKEDMARLRSLSVSGIQRDEGLAGLLLRLPVQGLLLRFRLRRLGRIGTGASRALLREARRVARQKAQIERRLVLLERLQRLFHYWHVFHKPFALIMYLFLAVHVAVALMTGYGWSGA